MDKTLERLVSARDVAIIPRLLLGEMKANE